MSIQQEQIPTAQTDIPAELFSVEQSGLNREFIEQNGLELRDLAQGPVEIEIDSLEPMEESNGIVMLGVLDVAGVPLKLHGVRDERGKLYEDYITVSPADYEPSSDTVSDEVIQLRILPISQNSGERIIGRTASGAGRLDLQDNMLVSRSHFGISIENGVLKLRDLNSTNGTSLVTAPKKEFAVEAPKTYETDIDGKHFKMEGAFPTSDRGDVLVMSSTDEKGTTRRFIVYRSNSEGGMRVSQGYEPNHRYIKGAENSGHTQYTQDTQLHPKFKELIDSILIDKHPATLADASEFVAADDDKVDKLMEDFETQVDVRGFFSQKLNKELFRTQAGSLSEKSLIARLGSKPDKLTKDLKSHLASINKELEDSGTIPAFDKPDRVEHDTHGHLGQITREVYTHVVGHRKFEWYMAYDDAGRVWIDRIRFAASEATAYGTDQELVYSGILTSKPIEYPKQVTGLPDEFKAGRVGGYEDITPFLDELAPVKKFRLQREITRR